MSALTRTFKSEREPTTGRVSSRFPCWFAPHTTRIIPEGCLICHYLFCEFFLLFPGSQLYGILPNKQTEKMERRRKLPIDERPEKSDQKAFSVDKPVWLNALVFGIVQGRNFNSFSSADRPRNQGMA